SGRSHAGRFPQAVQVAQDVRPPREFLDVADQRQPQSLHRSLPQHAPRARGGDARRRRVLACPAVDDRESADDARAPRSRWPAARRARQARALAAHGGDAARHSGAELSGDRRAPRRPRGHGEVAHQSGPHGTCAADCSSSRTAGIRGREEPAPIQPPSQDRSFRMNLTTDHAQGVAIIRVQESRLLYPLLSEFASTVTGLISGGEPKLLLDLSTVTYVDSATIGCLMDLYRQATAAGGALKLTGVQKRVETMLTMTGAHNFLEIHADEPSAIKSF